MMTSAFCRSLPHVGYGRCETTNYGEEGYTRAGNEANRHHSLFQSSRQNSTEPFIDAAAAAKGEHFNPPDQETPGWKISSPDSDLRTFNGKLEIGKSDWNTQWNVGAAIDKSGLSWGHYRINEESKEGFDDIKGEYWHFPFIDKGRFFCEPERRKFPECCQNRSRRYANQLKPRVNNQSLLAETTFDVDSVDPRDTERVYNGTGDSRTQVLDSRNMLRARGMLNLAEVRLKGTFLSNAVEQCEEHTSWTNDLLKSRGLASMVDIRKSFADGITLVNLLEILSNEKLPNIHRSPCSGSETVENLERCVEHLDQQGVDTSGINAQQLADGNLKATLMLMNNIRKRYDSQYSGRDADGSSRPNSSGSYHYRDNMPATQSKPQQGNIARDVPPPSRSRPVSSNDAVLPPGVIPSSDPRGHIELQPLRKQPHDPVTPHRPRSAGPPNKAQPAWSANVSPTRPRASQPPASSVEQRLKSLINTAPATGVYNKAFNYEDGELLMPPPPRPDSSFDETLADPADREIMHYKYEPSHPSERPHPSSRGAPPVPPKYQPPPQYSPHPGTRNPHPDPRVPQHPESPHPGQRVPNPDPRVPHHPSESPHPGSRNPHPDPRISHHPESPGAGVHPSERAYPQGPRVHPGGSGHSAHQGQQQRLPSTAESPHAMTSRPTQQQQQQQQQQPPVIHNGHPTQPPAVDLRNACNKLYGRQTQISSAYPSKPGYPSSPYMSRTSPMGQSSSPPSQSSGGSSHQAPPAPPQRNMDPLRRAEGRAGEGGSRPNSQDRQLLHEQRPKTPVQQEQQRPKTPIINLPIETPRTPQQQHATQQRQITSTPKVTGMSDPYQRTLYTSQQQQQQRNLLQSKSLIPETIAQHHKVNSKQSLSLDPNQWNKSYSDISSRSVTPPLPPLSPDNTPPTTPPPIAPTQASSSTHPHAGYHHDRPDVVISTAKKSGSPRKKSVRSVGLKTWDGRSKRAMYGSGGRNRSGSKPRRSRGGSAADTVSESPDDEDDDIGDTTTNASGTEDMSDTGGGQEVSIIRQQLEGLETMYHEILKVLGIDKEYIPAGTRRSISSMSSLSRTPGNRRAGRRASQHMHGGHGQYRRELKKVSQRFQRLESHVVTLARSVAHLSSELRSHNALLQDVEDMKQALEEMRNRAPAAAASPGAGGWGGPPPGVGGAPGMSEWEKFRGWVPALTNPKRVQKLKKFFGTDPPLLKLFLQKLGYERYSPNFEQEHISIVELPYLNEERLQKIGIPMGPRLRILQESQMCFRQDNFNIYIV